MKISWNLNVPISTATWISVILLFSGILLHCPVFAKKCPGRCISNATECKSKGGKVAGYCTNQLACCDFSYKKIGTCGAKMSELATAIFRSPDYPDVSHGDLICQFDFALDPNATGVIVEFTDVTLDGRGFVHNSACESDVVYLKGFPDWTPPGQCGNLTNYAAVINLKSRLAKGLHILKVLVLASSKKYKWNIKVSQVFNVTPPVSYFSTTPPSTEHESDPEDGEDDAGDMPGEVEEGILYHNNYGETEEEEFYRIISTLKLDPSSVSFSDDSEDWANAGDEYNDLSEEPLIVNGDDTDITSIPWQASLRTIVTPRIAKLLPALKLKNCSIEEGIHFCGGSVISDRHILSAVHCFLTGDKLATWQQLSTMKVVLGDSNNCDNNKDGVQEFNVDKVYYHYAYDTEVLISDVVVIKLKERIRFTDRVKPIKMAEVGMSFVHQEAMVSGWGLTNLTAKESKKQTPEQLQVGHGMFIGNRTTCTKEQLKLYPRMTTKSLQLYPKYAGVFNSLLCTYVRDGDTPIVVGQGDSGGPMVVKVENSTEPLLVGVCSYMVPLPNPRKPHDVSNYVDFYQSVAYFRKWIELAMQ